jgi:methionyl-tRNA formyltransferase
MYFKPKEIFSTMKIVFMGSAEFGIPALEKLFKSGHEIVGIVSTPSRRKGRGLRLCDSPIVLRARELGINPILVPEHLKSMDFIAALTDLNADVYVVVAYRILPPEVFLLPRLGTINIHASLLPKYRGPAPIQRAIQYGETQTGITIFRIDAGIDTGNIILQNKLTIGNKETTPQLYKRLSELGAESLPEAIAALESGKALFTQNSERATPAPKLVKAEGQIYWNRPAIEIFNMLRAFKPFPGAYTFLDGHRIAIEWALPIEGAPANPGAVSFVTDEYFEVQCGKGSLRVLEVKPEAKKAMSARAYMQGRKLTVGMSFN